MIIKNPLNVLDGFMLSDGCIRIERKYKNAKFSQKSKYLEYALYIKDLFSSLGISCPPSYPCWAGKSSYGALIISTNTSEILTEQRKRWYPKGIKIVPNDIILNPDTIKHWFIGDGNLSYCKGKFERIKLATNGFSHDDRFLLMEKLQEIGFISKESSIGEIYIKKSLAQKFLEYIEECPINCYKYKWIINDWNAYSLLKINEQDNQQRISYLLNKKIGERSTTS